MSAAMQSLGPHAAFIIAAYALTVATVAILVAWIALDHRAQRRKLRKLEAEGITRRSGGDAGDEP